MSRVAVFVDVQPGHVLPTYELARHALAHGHVVNYFAPPDVVQLIRMQGFEAIEVLNSALPLGYTDELRRQANSDQDRMLELAQMRVIPSLASGEGLGPAIDRFHPDLLVMSSLYQLEALAIYLRHAVRIALFTTNVRLHTRAEACRIDLSRLFEMQTGVQEMVDLIQSKLPHAHTFDQLVPVVMAFPDLNTIPKALDLPGTIIETNSCYFGSSVSPDRVEGQFELNGVGLDTPLIYCSLGSQAHVRWPVKKRFFQEALSAAAHRPACHMVVSVGPQSDPEVFQPLPSNASIFRWAPQLAVLKRATLMMTHAGMGTLKECILAGVPMLAFPLGQDQYACAARIAHYGLGLVGDIESVKASDLEDMIDRSVYDCALRNRVAQMRQAVLKEDEAGDGRDIVADMLQMAQEGGPG